MAESKNTKDDSPKSTSSSDTEGEEEDQIGKNVGQGPVAIDRDEYLAAYRELVFDRTQLQVKNNILHKRLAEYYKKRKFDQVLKPYEGPDDMEEKYHQKLFAYEELKEKEHLEVTDIKSKVAKVKAEYVEQLNKADKKFSDLQSHEKNTGSGLIYSKKGKPISDKTVAKFLSLQKAKSEQTSVMHLKYLRVRNAVAELENVVRELERIGPGLYVAQYEQLRVDKINYSNKVEERDDELIRNRTRCSEHNQILAHIREKMHHTDEVIDITECDLGDAEIEYQRAREDLSVVKGRRDKLRWLLEGEREKAGLLTRKDLLRDYQDAIDLVVKLKEKKEGLEAAIASTNRKLRELRKAESKQPETVSLDVSILSGIWKN